MRQVAYNLKPGRSFKHLSRIFLVAALCFFQTARAFPAEDLNVLIARADEALARGDYQQTFTASTAILDADPRNLTGYRLALICCVMNKWEIIFYKLIEEAKKRGIPVLLIDRMAAEICYLGGQRVGLDVKLAEYEREWMKSNDPSH